MSDLANDDRIVITADEAKSAHVDDLLRRQMSLRGESCVTVATKRRWYYQNWLLFMLVGALFAAGAWAIIEPLFDDYLYVQGKIESISGLAQPAGSEEAFETPAVTIRGEKILLPPELRRMTNGRVSKIFDPAGLAVGQEVGLYTRYMSGRTSDVAVAHYIDPAPKQPASGKALQSLESQNGTNVTMSFLIFSIVAGMIGLGVGAADGIVCRLPRRALLGGLVGALVGFVGGLFSHVLASVVYAPLSHYAMTKFDSGSEGTRAFGFLVQMIARMLAWTLAGSAMGLGQGIALRSKRLLVYGFLGGVIGGLVGGLLFDPIDIVIIGADRASAAPSRLIGFVVIGAAVGAMIGVVELLTRDAWLRMVEGPLAGKEFLIFRDVMNIGASPRSEIYLFNDDKVAPTHATLRVIGDQCEISARDRVRPLLVNGNGVQTARLRQGDRITIGNTSFLFEQRQR